MYLLQLSYMHLLQAMFVPGACCNQVDDIITLLIFKGGLKGVCRKCVTISVTCYSCSICLKCVTMSNIRLIHQRLIVTLH